MTLLGNAFVCATDNNSTNFEDPYKDLVPDWICALEYVPWCWAIFGSLLVGLSGVLPLLVIPIDQSDNLKQGDSANKLKTLLSFAVGGLLGDVFLHSLPEIWANDTVTKFDNGHHISNSGLLILTGLIIFVAAEKLFSVIEQVENSEINTVENNNTKGLKQPLGQKKSNWAGSCPPIPYFKNLSISFSSVQLNADLALTVYILGQKSKFLFNNPLFVFLCFCSIPFVIVKFPTRE